MTTKRDQLRDALVEVLTQHGLKDHITPHAFAIMVENMLDAVAKEHLAYDTQWSGNDS